MESTESTFVHAAFKADTRAVSCKKQCRLCYGRWQTSAAQDGHHGLRQLQVLQKIVAVNTKRTTLMQALPPDPNLLMQALSRGQSLTRSLHKRNPERNPLRKPKPNCHLSLTETIATPNPNRTRLAWGPSNILSSTSAFT